MGLAECLSELIQIFWHSLRQLISCLQQAVCVAIIWPNWPIVLALFGLMASNWTGLVFWFSLTLKTSCLRVVWWNWLVVWLSWTIALVLFDHVDLLLKLSQCFVITWPSCFKGTHFLGQADALFGCCLDKTTGILPSWPVIWLCLSLLSIIWLTWLSTWLN